MNYIGISAGFHDAAISVVNQSGDILFAAHSERYSKKKHDLNLSQGLVIDALKHTDSSNLEFHYYERPWVKAMRQLRSGEGFHWPSWDRLLGESYNIMGRPNIHTHPHHRCHAAAGFQTSAFDAATVVVIDAIGEFDTVTIWDAWYEHGRARYKKVYSLKYPDSIGLFYSAMTARVGLKPMDEEYILMGMAAYGSPVYLNEMREQLIDMQSIHRLRFTKNLHIGVDQDFLPHADHANIASTAQYLVESMIRDIMQQARKHGKSRNLVYGGGVALNCLANRFLGQYFEKIWIMPNPGDAGNSLGASCLAHGGRVQWKNCFLGHEIPGVYPVNEILDHLVTDKIVGVASGRAEFGPRALGNRSLLADPRGYSIKNRVNEIKRRQKFRPFAPVILQEHAEEYFEMPQGFETSAYMQVVAQCREPSRFPAIVHKDNTSRVQTVPRDGSGIRQLLEKWYVMTGCPILLNTSLNIRGEPMVNDRADADRFQRCYGVKVCS